MKILNKLIQENNRPNKRHKKLRENNTSMDDLHVIANYLNNSDLLPGGDISINDGSSYDGYMSLTDGFVSKKLIIPIDVYIDDDNIKSKKGKQGINRIVNLAINDLLPDLNKKYPNKHITKNNYNDFDEEILDEYDSLLNAYLDDCNYVLEIIVLFNGTNEVTIQYIENWEPGYNRSSENFESYVEYNMTYNNINEVINYLKHNLTDLCDSIE